MKRPIIPFGGSLGELFKQLFTRLERLEAVRSPGVLTSITTRGVVTRPLEKKKKTNANSSAPVWL